MILTRGQTALIEAIIRTGRIELAINLLGKQRKTAEQQLWLARKDNNVISTIHLCIAYILHNPDAYIPHHLKPQPELPQPPEIIKTDCSKAAVTFNDDALDIDDIIDFKESVGIHESC